MPCEAPSTSSNSGYVYSGANGESVREDDQSRQCEAKPNRLTPPIRVRRGETRNRGKKPKTSFARKRAEESALGSQPTFRKSGNGESVTVLSSCSKTHPDECLTQSTRRRWRGASVAR